MWLGVTGTINCSKYRNCKIPGICKSKKQCRLLQLQNKEVFSADIGTFEMEASCDRIYSIEMFEDDVSVVDHWLLNGKHYAQTSEELFKRMDKNLALMKPIMESSYGKDEAFQVDFLQENNVYGSGRTLPILQRRRMDGCSFPIN